MSNIIYNEKQEAYELPYKIWDNMITVRFYTESEDEIMQNLGTIANQLEYVNSKKNAVAALIADEGLYNGAPETLAGFITLESIYIDIDEDGIVICFNVSSSDGYMNPVSVELYEDDFEVIGRAEY